MTGRNVRRVERHSGRAWREPVATAHSLRSLRGAESLYEAEGKQTSKLQKWDRKKDIFPEIQKVLGGICATKEADERVWESRTGGRYLCVHIDSMLLCNINFT